MMKKIQEWMDSPATEEEIKGLERLVLLVTGVTLIGLVTFIFVVGMFVIAFLEMRAGL